MKPAYPRPMEAINRFNLSCALRTAQALLPPLERDRAPPFPLLSPLLCAVQYSPRGRRNNLSMDRHRLLTPSRVEWPVISVL